MRCSLSTFELRIGRRDVDDLARLADAYVEPHRTHGRRGQCDHDTHSTRSDPVEGSNRGWTVEAAAVAERMLESLGSDAIRHDRWRDVVTGDELCRLSTLDRHTPGRRNDGYDEVGRCEVSQRALRERQ